MTHGSHLLLRLCLFSLALFITGLSVRLTLKVRSRAAWMSPADLAKAIIQKMSRPLAWVTVGALLGIPIGWNLHHPSEVKTIENALVLKKRSDVAFQLLTPKDGRLEKTFCAPPDFEAGDGFYFIDYVKAGPCSEIRGQGRGYKAFTDERTGRRVKFPIEEEIADAR